MSKIKASRPSSPTPNDLIDVRPFDRPVNALTFTAELMESLEMPAEVQPMLNARVRQLENLSELINFKSEEPIVCMFVGRLAYDKVMRERIKKFIELVEMNEEDEQKEEEEEEEENGISV